MQKKLLIFNIYIFFIIAGIIKTIIGPVLPTMIDNYSVTLAVAGLVISMLSFGRLISVSSAAVWLDSIGYKPVFLTGAALISVGMFGFGIVHWWWGHLMFMLVTGLGFGMIGSSSNALIAELNPQKRGKALNRLHMFFGIGSLVGPVIAGLFLNFNWNWRFLFTIVAALSLLTFVFSLTREFPETGADEDDGIQEHSAVRLKRLINRPIFYLLAVIMFIYVGVGNGIVGWVNKYLGDTLAFSGFAASGVLAIYSLGLTLGRVTWSFFSDSLGYKKTILLCSAGSLMTISVAVLSSMTTAILIGFGLTGFFLAGLFPTVLAYGSQLFPRMLGTISSSLVSTAVMGGVIIPWVMGIISEYFGLKGGMMTTIIFAVILVGSSILLFFIDEKKEVL